MSSFVETHISSSLSSTTLDTEPGEVDSSLRSNIAEPYYELLLSLKSPLDKAAVHSTLARLHSHEETLQTNNAQELNGEGDALRATLQTKIFLGLYAEALDTCLQEAAEADSEADWWGDLARTRQNIAWYLLQTLPERLKRGFDAVVDTLRAQNAPITLSSFSPRSLNELYPQSMRPSALMTALFPHLSRQSHVLFRSPFDLTRQECISRKKELLKLRDKHAEILGHLLYMKSSIGPHLVGESELVGAVSQLRSILGGRDLPDSIQQSSSTTSRLHDISTVYLSKYKVQHVGLMTTLRRPSRLTLLWPRLVLIPPASLLILRYIYGNRDSLAETAVNVVETIKGFWFGYVVEPIKGILNTVRTGGEEGARIVNAEGVKADLDSLERMALDLSKDKLSFSPSEFETIKEQIHQGDLTPVMKIYEEDIKAPIKSAITGSLVRSLLIQIQKAKVDLDRTLTGIDKLLKSQELTFAFVGVAPSLAIVYFVTGYLQDLWKGGRGNSKYGGKNHRAATFTAIRRVERLLNHVDEEQLKQGRLSMAAMGSSSASTLPPVTTGLLLISVSHLRKYAEKYLPERSRLREGFLEDVADLEDPDLDRFEKQQVVDRMWRSWGTTLGWVNLASTSHS